MTLAIPTPLDDEPAACFAPEELADAASRVQLLLRQHEVNQGLKDDVERLTNELARERADGAKAVQRAEVAENRVKAAYSYVTGSNLRPRVKTDLRALLTGRA